MKRRDFIRSLALAAGVVPLGAHSWAAMSEVPTREKLVVVLLRGAVDGLNVVVPYDEPDYYRLRPGIALGRPGGRGGVLDLDGRFGLHPALAPLADTWKTGRLAFVHAAGSPDSTRSHFDAQDYMESGTPGRKSTQDGWMNRLLSTLPGPASPTRAVSLGPVMPRILSGSMPVANLASGAAGMKPSVLDRPKVGSAFDALYAGKDKFGDTYRQAQSAHKEMMASMEDEMRAADGGAPLPNGFPGDAARLATLMRKDPKVQLAFLALGGWDTHANQGAATGQLANRLAPLGEGMAALAQGLGPLFDDTVVVVMSEFGRTVRQNGNGGTDHGHGNVMWLMGGAVRGGRVHGEWPGLRDSQLYEGRDLAVTTDFRSVLAQVAERHLRLPDNSLERLFPEMPASSAGLRLFA